MVSWAYSDTRSFDSETNLTKSVHFWPVPFILPLILLNHSENCRGVVGGTNANGPMLRRSAQLLLVTENDQFEGRALTNMRSNLRPA